MTPTSIVVAGAGSSASIRADGGVDFATATSLSLNGVFTSTYDDYMIVVRHTSAGTNVLEARLRLSGTDATASNYTRQFLLANGSSVSGGRESTQTSFRFGSMVSTNVSGDTAYIYGPALAQPTALRIVNCLGRDGARIEESCGTHSLSTAYDGITFLPSGTNFTGMVTVYGYAQ
jgi:hypothetical protein